MKKVFLFLIVVTSFAPNSLDASPEQLFKAVKGNDLATVQALIKAGENVRITAEDPNVGIISASPLYYAIDNGNYEMAKLLIAARADVNEIPSFEGPGGLGYDDSLLVLAGVRGHWDIVELLLSAGAVRKDFDAYFNVTVERTLNPRDKGSLPKAEKILDRMRQYNVPLGIPLLYWLLQYERGGAEVRKFISENVPEIAQRKASLLNRLLATGQEGVALFGTDGTIPLPLATSSLQDPKVPGRYSADKAFDGDLKTSWVEGVEGPGIGEKLAFEVRPAARSIAVVPGYGDSQYYTLNNRVKTAKLSLYVLSTSPAENATFYHSRKLSEQDLSFTDSMTFQQTALYRPPVTLGYGEHLVGVLEILSVYPGSKYDDTCIAEIRVK